MTEYSNHLSRGWLPLLYSFVVLVLIAATGVTITAHGPAVAVQQSAAASTVKYYLPYPAGSSYSVSQAPGGQISHTGNSAQAIDFKMGANSPVAASASGILVKRQFNEQLGNLVWIRHDDGYCTMYAHMTAYSPAVKNLKLNEGRVSQGQIVGSVGSTGSMSSGPHLHFGRTACGWQTVNVDFVEVANPAYGQSYRSQNAADSSPAPQPSLAQYANSIVKWEKDDRTSWFVTPDLKRLWIPDGTTYNELKARGFAGPSRLSSTTLDRLADQQNQWVASGSHWTGNRSLRKEMLVHSGNGRYKFVLQGDGNLVLYGPSGRAIWATDRVTSRWQEQVRVIFQGDGNLVTYDANNRPIWATGTAGRGATHFVVQGDGNLVIYANSRPLWASNTAGRT